MPDLASIVPESAASRFPLLLCASAGHDPSPHVDVLAALQKAPCLTLAMGSATGCVDAERAIRAASRRGGWVLLKNVHLVPAWLPALEKLLHALHAPHPPRPPGGSQPDELHQSFRLFLTMEIADITPLPVALLALCCTLVYEPPVGMRANLLCSLEAAAPRMQRAPRERARLHLQLAWTHALIVERQAFVPVGWSKAYAFGAADLSYAQDMLDRVVDVAAAGRGNLPPEKMPCSALCVLLAECAYGGRVDFEADRRLMGSLIATAFAPEAFELGHRLAEGVVPPEGAAADDILHWARGLAEPARRTAWLGIPADAEEQRLHARAAQLLQHLRVLGSQTQRFALG